MNALRRIILEGKILCDKRDDYFLIQIRKTQTRYISSKDKVIYRPQTRLQRINDISIAAFFVMARLINFIPSICFEIPYRLMTRGDGFKDHFKYTYVFFKSLNAIPPKKMKKDESVSEPIFASDFTPFEVFSHKQVYDYEEWRKDREKWFESHRSIPKAFERDPALGQLICHITNLPIRYPVYEEVRDAGNTSSKRIYYDKFAIASWLLLEPISPFTKRRLSVGDISEDKELEEQITRRLDDLMKDPCPFEITPAKPLVKIV